MSCIKEILHLALIIYYIFWLRNELTIVCLSVCDDPPGRLPSPPPAHPSLLAQPGGNFPRWGGAEGERGRQSWLLAVRWEVLQAPPHTKVLVWSTTYLLYKEGKKEVVKLQSWVIWSYLGNAGGSCWHGNQGVSQQDDLWYLSALCLGWRKLEERVWGLHQVSGVE